MKEKDPLLHDLEQRAVRSAAERAREDAQAPVDLIREIQGDAAGPEGPAPDLTFDGYVEVHDRVPAFEGADGEAYTVGIDTEETGDPERPWAAFFVFVRWAETGAGIMGHVESGDIAFGPTRDGAGENARQLTLYEIKSELDAAIRRRADMLER